MTDADFEAAKAEWEKDYPDKPWDSLRTQSRNRLAKEQKYHREFAELCDTIKTLGIEKQNKLDQCND